MMSDDARRDSTGDPGRPWVSVAQAAEASGRTPRQVRNWIEQRKVRAERNERGDWLIHPDDVAPGSGLGSVSPRKSTSRTSPLRSGSSRPELPSGTTGGEPDLMVGFEVTLLRIERDQALAELAAVRAELAAREALLEDRTTQLLGVRAALRAMVDAVNDPKRV